MVELRLREGEYFLNRFAILSSCDFAALLSRSAASVHRRGVCARMYGRSGVRCCVRHGGRRNTGCLVCRSEAIHGARAELPRMGIACAGSALVSRCDIFGSVYAAAVADGRRTRASRGDSGAGCGACGGRQAEATDERAEILDGGDRRGARSGGGRLDGKDCGGDRVKLKNDVRMSIDIPPWPRETRTRRRWGTCSARAMRSCRRPL